MGLGATRNGRSTPITPYKGSWADSAKFVGNNHVVQSVATESVSYREYARLLEEHGAAAVRCIDDSVLVDLSKSTKHQADRLKLK